MINVDISVTPKCYVIRWELKSYTHIPLFGDNSKVVHWLGQRPSISESSWLRSMTIPIKLCCVNSISPIAEKLGQLKASKIWIRYERMQDSSELLKSLAWRRHWTDDFYWSRRRESSDWCKAFQLYMYNNPVNHGGWKIGCSFIQS